VKRKPGGKTLSGKVSCLRKYTCVYVCIYIYIYIHSAIFELHVFAALTGDHAVKALS
jgi:hypothetical protein